MDGVCFTIASSLTKKMLAETSTTYIFQLGYQQTIQFVLIAFLPSSSVSFVHVVNFNPQLFSIGPQPNRHPYTSCCFSGQVNLSQKSAGLPSKWAEPQQLQQALSTCMCQSRIYAQSQYKRTHRLHTYKSTITQNGNRVVMIVKNVLLP